MSIQPDLDRDVIVQHVNGDSATGERWPIWVRADKRADLGDARGALVFARLLADLQQRRVWVRHADDDELRPLDHRGLGGCSCC
jgi:hypothetical protein